ncbi:MAG: flagellar basal-body rod protein FlgG [Candidatus Abyssobacteria bacterium SURF_5]|uniref:Flagellar basal-body rod protein FlgG n=1 Tax=Abyssobacteria bacterium (strain SURF_5) TaxID=2093360 RepID=A0A3A4PDW5_ABYX5|nr:MAG: flagellar basal-body rod protein FlgG [Candidatus Abyssubacteria bacterium SURF_5]
MQRSLFTGATGMKGQQTSLDVLANNLANVNTTAFKRSRVDFQDLLYQTIRAPGAVSSQGFEIPSGIQLGNGVGVSSITKIFQQGSFIASSNSLDVAIEGDGFFEITLPDGSIAYTRDGSFKMNRDGVMVTSDGYPLEPEISIPDDAIAITIGSDGTVSATLSDSSIDELGQIELARFINPAGLLSHGRNLYLETEASGDPILSVPGEEGAGTLRQGFLEGSNVSVVDEIVQMIITQRAFEVNSSVIRTSDEMLQTANNMRT